MKSEKPEDLSLNSILDRLRQEYWNNLSEVGEQQSQEGVELLTFWLGSEYYAVDLALSRHLLKLPKIVRLPQVPRYVLGVCNLRGEIVPVMDLRILFGLKLAPESADSRLLVVEAKGIMAAIWLDRVGDIIFAETKNLRKATGEESVIPSQYLKGYFVPVEEKDKLLIYLDLGQLLSSEQLVSGIREG
jgi:purine-binding chemotaxis protein CheW